MQRKRYNTITNRARASLLAGVGLAFFSVLAQADVLFQENFDSSLGQFTSTGSVSVTTSGARMAGSFGGTDGAITSSPISTVGFTGITLTLTRTTTGLDSGEAGIAEFSTNGSTYTVIQSLQTASGAVTLNLPATAGGQSSLRLRFRVNASSSTEYFTVDSIRLEGTPGSGGGGGGTNPYQRGPAPTTSSLDASRGPFSVGSRTVSDTQVSGYDGGTLWYPTNTSEGPFAAIAIIPGFLSSEGSIREWGPRLASWGFVVITVETLTYGDLPPSRRDQLIAAMNDVLMWSDQSGHPIYGKVDKTRQALMGWSMGGGGTLLGLQENPTRFKAGIGLAPWNSTETFTSSIRQPVLIFACESDIIAPVASHAYPFYRNMPTTNKKAFAEVNNGDHFCANDPRNNSGRLGRYGVSWMKRFLDDDTRFTQFLCGTHSTWTFSRYLSTCPY